MAFAKASLYLLWTSFVFLGAGVVAVLGRLLGQLYPSPSSTTLVGRTEGRRTAKPLLRWKGCVGLEGGYEEYYDEETYYNNHLAIAPGELPGYTGWARPERTLAGHFRIVSVGGPDRPHRSSSVVWAGEEWSVVVECASFSPECARSAPRRGKEGSGAHFYLRAYGPAVITGSVDYVPDGGDGGGGAYRLSFYPVDQGRYTVEAVLAFSDAPPFLDFPLSPGDDGGGREPGYEGYLLPGFPLNMVVLGADDADADAGAEAVAGESALGPGRGRLLGGGVGPGRSAREEFSSPRPRRNWCSFEQLVEAVDDGSKYSDAALRSGRWKVVDRVQGGGHLLATDDPDSASLRGYQQGINSLGVAMRYVPNDCDLLPETSMVSSSPLPSRRNGSGKRRHLWDQCLTDVGIANSTDPADQIRFILIGDSVMRLQEEALRGSLTGSTAKNVKISRISMFGGISRTLSNVTADLRDIRQGNPDERRIVVFNSALHDVDRLCSSEMRSSRKKHFPGVSDDDLVCVEFYEELLGRLVDVVAKYPAELKVFRTANAAWPKYGNFGFAWPTTKVQPFSRSPNFVAKINEIAYDVIPKRGQGGVHIIDGYWMSLPRPDHTEVGSINTIGKHMVHPGVEVISAMTMKVLMLALRQICDQTLNDWV